MAFFIDTRGEPTTGSRIGEAIGQGLGQGMQAGMQLKLSDMLERQKSERLLDQHAAMNKQLGLNKLLGVRELRVPTDQVLNTLKQMSEYGDRQALNDYYMTGGAQPTKPQSEPSPMKGIKQKNVQPANVDFNAKREDENQKYQNAMNNPSLGLKSKEKISKDHFQNLAAIDRQEKIDQKNREIASREAIQKAKKSNLSKEDTKWLDEALRNKDTALKSIEDLDKMKEIREGGDLGKTLSWLSPSGRTSRSRYNMLASNFLKLYKSFFPRGFTQNEFAVIKSDFIPNSGNTDADNEAKEQVLREMSEHLLKAGQIISQHRRKDGTYPKNIRGIVDNEMNEDLTAFKNKTLYGMEPQRQQENQEQVYPEGTEADVDGVPSVFTNGAWVAK